MLEALGRGHLRAYRLREAQECFTALLELRPDSLAALLGRGWAHQQQPYLGWGGPNGMYDSIPDFRAAVELAPWCSDARLGLSEALLDKAWRKTPEVEEAIGHLRTVLAAEPNSERACALLAQALILLERFGEAQALLDDFLRNHPNSIPVLAMRIRVADWEGRERDVFEWSRRLLALASYHREALFRTARHLADAGRHTEAEELFRRFDTFRDAEGRLEELRWEMGGWVKHPNPLDPALRYEAGELALRMGRPDEAVQRWSRALMEEPTHGPSLKALESRGWRATPPPLNNPDLHPRL